MIFSGVVAEMQQVADVGGDQYTTALIEFVVPNPHDTMTFRMANNGGTAYFGFGDEAHYPHSSGGLSFAETGAFSGVETTDAVISIKVDLSSGVAFDLCGHIKEQSHNFGDPFDGSPVTATGRYVLFRGPDPLDTVSLSYCPGVNSGCSSSTWESTTNPRSGWVFGDLGTITVPCFAIDDPNQEPKIGTAMVDMLSGTVRFVPVHVGPWITLDFKNGIYEVDGVATPLADIVLDDRSLQEFDQSVIVPNVGMVLTASTPDDAGNHYQAKGGWLRLKPTALDLVTSIGIQSGWSTLMVGTRDVVGSKVQSSFGCGMESIPGGTGWSFDGQWGHPNDSANSTLGDYDGYTGFTYGAASPFRAAVTLSEGRVAASINGEPISEYAAYAMGDEPSIYVGASASSFAGSVTTTVERIVIYPPKSNEELVALASVESVGFAAGAARFSGAENLFVPALAGTDSGFVTMSFWINYSDTDALGNAISYAVDPDNAYGTYASLLAGGANSGKFATALQSNTDYSYEKARGDTIITVGDWHHFLVSFRSDGSSTKLAIYHNRILDTVNMAHSSTPFVPSLAGLPFYVASDGYRTTPAIFDMGEFWLDMGTDFFEADGTISNATLDKFISPALAPVDLGSSGQLPTGSAPIIYLHRDPTAAVETFADNLGTGGAITLADGTMAEPPTNPGV